MKKDSAIVDAREMPIEISKTKAKREMEDLQKLGVALSKLGSEQLAQIELPDVLRDAIKLAQKITSNGGTSSITAYSKLRIKPTGSCLAAKSIVASSKLINLRSCPDN